jgi:biotin operon repressor
VVKVTEEVKKSRAPRPFKMTVRRELAAKLLAEDELSDAKIAEQCGISRAVWYLRASAEQVEEEG